jgi:hypothetical protein
MPVTFCEGINVYYNGFFGTIRFVCSHYITVCIQSSDDKIRDVCLIVYPEDYKSIALAKESTK